MSSFQPDLWTKNWSMWRTNVEVADDKGYRIIIVEPNIGYIKFSMIFFDNGIMILCRTSTAKIEVKH